MCKLFFIEVNFNMRLVGLFGSVFFWIGLVEDDFGIGVDGVMRNSDKFFVGFVFKVFG